MQRSERVLRSKKDKINFGSEEAPIEGASEEVALSHTLSLPHLGNTIRMGTNLRRKGSNYVV